MHSLPFPEFVRDHAESTGYSAEVPVEGFKRVWHNLTPETLTELIRKEAPELLSHCTPDFWFSAQTTLAERKRALQQYPHEKLLLVTASTVPPAAFQDALVSLILPLHVTIRPAHNLVPIMEALVEHVRRHAPLLGERLHVIDTGHDETALRELVASHDIINVSGSDATIERYRACLPANKHIPMIEHGHRVSAIALLKHEIESITDSTLESIAVDGSIWDQTGCLSPKLIFAECSFEAACSFAQKLAIAYDKIALQLPELSPELSLTAQKNMALRMCAFDGAAVFNAHNNHDSIVVFPPNSPIQPILLPRTITLFCVPDALESLPILAPHGQCLCTLKQLPQHIINSLQHAGFNYFCQPGQMQKPPLTWFHDGIGTLKPLFCI